MGFVSQMPSGPGIITDQLIRTLCSYVPKDVESFLLSSRRTAAELLEQAAYCNPTTIQLCRPLSQPECQRAGELLRKHKLVHVVHVNGQSAFATLERVRTNAHEILLDTGDLLAEPPQLGGTGRCHDWVLAAQIRAQVAMPVWLAGGLTSENVQGAIQAVSPDGVDVCSGVRRRGALCPRRLREFVSAVTSV